jgi:integrase
LNGIVRVTETKTKKKNVFVVNPAIHKVLAAYLTGIDSKDDDYLFKTKYGEKMTSVYAGRLVQDWCQKIGIDQGVFGCHTLRKTWAYHMRTKFQVDWSLITTRLNHSSPLITRRYLGIEESEVITILQNVIE